MTPTRANIAGPSRSTASISVSIAACHSGRADSLFFRQAGDVVTGVPQRDQRSPVGQQYWILKFALPAVVSQAALSCSKDQ